MTVLERINSKCEEAHKSLDKVYARMESLDVIKKRAPIDNVPDYMNIHVYHDPKRGF